MLRTGKYQDEHCIVNFDDHQALLDNYRITLTRKEFELLATLVGNAGEIVPRQVLLKDIWGYGQDIRTRTLDVHIRRIRKKMGNFGEQYIETIFGVGYRLET